MHDEDPYPLFSIEAPSFPLIPLSTFSPDLPSCYGCVPHSNTAPLHTRPFHNIWQWWHCRSSRHCRAPRGKITLSDDIANISTYFLRIHFHYAVEQYRNVTTKCMKVFCYLINAYPLSLKMRISCMEPKLAKVFCSSSSERPFAMPPQYTVQLVGLDWLYTSSKVKGLELAVKDQEKKMHN